MTNDTTKKGNEGLGALAKQADRLIVKPLSRKMTRETEEVERYLRGLLAAIQVEFAFTRRELSHRFQELEEAVELIARELATRRREGTSADQDRESRRPSQT